MSPPRTVIVDDNEVDKALDWLRDSAAEIGAAKRRAVLAGHMVSHVEALMSKTSNATSAEARKADARASQKWLDAVQEDAEAAGDMAKLYSLREAASAKIEAWRSEQANLRSMRI